MHHQLFHNRLESLALITTLLASCTADPADPAADSSETETETETETGTETAPALAVTEEQTLLIGPEGLDRLMSWQVAADVTGDIHSTFFNVWRLVYFHAETDGSLSIRQVMAGTTPSDEDPAIVTYDTPIVHPDGTLEIALEEPLLTAEVDISYYTWWESLEPYTLTLDDAGTVDRLWLRGDDLRMDRTVTLYDGASEARLHDLFAPYSPDVDFVPQEGDQSGSVVQTLPSTGAADDQPATSWFQKIHVQGEVVWFWTPETPAERVADIEVSIDYWNAVFTEVSGTAPLSLEPLPEDVTEVDPGAFVLRWVDDPSAGQAYAERNSDPFTGQLTGASVTSTPIFSWVVEADAPMVALEAQLDRGLPLVGIDAGRMDAIEHDYYVNTFTHEIGHALGLRHNFAGNLQTELTAVEVHEAIASYVLDAELPEALHTRSVMEYVPAGQAWMLGAAIAAGEGPLPYDVEVMRMAHGDDALDARGLMCELEHEGRFVDCLEFDAGPRLVADAFESFQLTLDQVAFAAAVSVVEGASLPEGETDGLIVATLFHTVVAQSVADADSLSAAASYGLPVDIYGVPVAPEDEPAYRADVLALQQAGWAGMSGVGVDAAAAFRDAGCEAFATASAADVAAGVEQAVVLAGASLPVAGIEDYTAELEASAAATCAGWGEVELAPSL